MKLTLALFICLLFSQMANAQTKSIAVFGGICRNGTGDNNGMVYGTEFLKYIKKSSFFWSASFGGTIHDGSQPIFYKNETGNVTDMSVNYTIAGFQTIGHIGVKCFNANKHQLTFKTGPLIRYQSSSYWDILHLIYDSGYPFPVVSFLNTTPRRTVALGLSTVLGYSYKLANDFSLGVDASFQFDTQEDNLRFLAFKFGKSF